MRRWSVLWLAAAGTVVTTGVADACDTCMGGGLALHAPLSGPIGSMPAFASMSTSLQVPVLSSRPTAAAKLYLDFDGDFSIGWGPYMPNHTPAYSVDSDPTTFSPLELDYIHRIWSAVAESYSPFEVDVTTVEPGPFDQRYFRVVIGGSGSWYPATVGGLAYVGAFQVNFLPKTGWVFSSNLSPDDPQHPLFVAAAVTHEAGHAFGLEHQSTWGPNGQLLDRYNRGDDKKAPYMGSSYRKRGLWWQGPNELGPHNIQDDLSILAGPANGFGYRADDHGDTPATATPMVVDGTTLFASGVIEKITDVDFFSFDAPGGDILFELYPAPWGAMLDGSLALYDASGGLLQLVATPSLGETLFATLDGGSYRVAVSSAGNYGDIGQYTLVGFLGGVIPEPIGMAVVALAGVIALRRRGM